MLSNMGAQTTIPTRHSRAYSNPQNHQSVDVYLVADTSSRNMNRLEFETLKASLINIADVLLRGYARIGIIFYGTSKAVDWVHETTSNNSISTIRTRVDQKQYFASSQNASTLAMAMKQVQQHCAQYCRNNSVPRVTVVFTSNLQPSDGTREARSLEEQQKMTIIAVGIKSQFNMTVLSQIASEPVHAYVLELSSYYELSAVSTIITNIITNVPRMFSLNELMFVTNQTDVYNTIQMDVSRMTLDSDIIIMAVPHYTSSDCIHQPSCFKMYGSLTQPNPTNDNAITAKPSIHLAELIEVDFIFYSFHVPKRTKRFYLSSIMSSSLIQITCSIIVLDVDISKENVKGKEIHLFR